MKKTLLITFLMLGIEAIAQTTTIPDAVFEQALIDLEIDSDGIINGQVLTSDIENITMLFLDGWEGLSELTDVTGIEDFSSLEMLQVSWTQITELDVSHNTLLRYLDCRGNLLTELDVSSNILLEELYISNVSDIWPQNEIKEIDLSNNPNIHTLQSIDLAIETINLKNGNNSTPMSININMIPWGAEPGIYNTVCIEVDNPELAQSNLPPYSEWEIEHVQAEFSFTSDCNPTIYIPDHIFEQALIDMEIDTDGIINERINVADALAVTSLEISYPYYEEYIYDLTGIEGFTNLEELTINGTYIEELNVSTLVNLKYLDCEGNTLTNINVTNNTLLEYLDISSAGDLYPINLISEIDLSNNPNINELIAWGNMSYINLKNGNNNPSMYIAIHSGNFDLPPDVIAGHTCIEVDDVMAAQNNQFPYSEWEIGNLNQSYAFAEDCSLGNIDMELVQMIKVYPNPASDVVNIIIQDGISFEKIKLYDIAGRLVKEFDGTVQNFSVLDLHKGIYILKAMAGQAIYSARIIIE